MRRRASWFGSLRPTGYKVAARVPRAPTAGSPRTRHPDHNQRAAVLGAVKARPGNETEASAGRARGVGRRSLALVVYDGHMLGGGFYPFLWENGVTAKARNVGGRPEHRPSPKDRRVVMLLAGVGISQDQIADAIGCARKTLAKHYHEELRVGSAKCAGGAVPFRRKR